MSAPIIAKVFASPFLFRYASSFARPNIGSCLLSKYRSAAVTNKFFQQGRVSMRVMSTSQFQSFVGHADLASKIMDEADRRHPNRTPPHTPDERWKERSKKALENVSRTPPAHTYSGRTVHVKVEGDLATAYRHLDGILNRNKVRATLRMTERHEKPGVKRRRLSSQRWRKRFSDEVRKKVQLVMKIRDRGA